MATRSPNPQFLTLADGLRLAVRVQGSGMPLLCLHGHPGSGKSMSVFTNPLSQRFRTLAPDLRGYGQSQTNRPFSMTQHVDDLVTLLDQMQVSECLVLGWSLGGILAMELALRQPQRIKGLVLVATAANPYSSHPPVNWADYAATGLASVLNRLRPGWQWNINTFGQRSLYRYLIQRHTPQAYTYLAEEGVHAYLKTSALANRALRQALRSRYNRLADLQAIPCPCLMLAAAEDRHITAQSSHETALALPHCHWQCYDRAAHLFPWEIPDQVLHDINQWLDQHLYPDPGSGI